MAEYRLRHPETGDVYVVGNQAERAQLRAAGYKEVKPEAPKPRAVRPEPKPEPKTDEK